MPSQSSKKKKLIKNWSKISQRQISKLFDPVQFYLISLLGFEYFVWYPLRWELFAYISSQSPSNFNVFVIRNFKGLFQYRYKARRLWKNSKLNSFLWTLFCLYNLSQKGILGGHHCCLVLLFWQKSFLRAKLRLYINIWIIMEEVQSKRNLFCDFCI